jgi:ribosome biogenesis GTPase / thiamine phosphate phosphatase
MSKRKQKPPRRRAWSAEDVDADKRESRRMHLAAESAGPEVDLDKCFSDTEPNGIVVSPYGVLAFVQWNGEETLCRAAQHLTDGRTSMLAPGDRVTVEMHEDEPTVVAVAHRRTKLSRPGVGRVREQIFAANADQLIIVMSAKSPPFKPGLVDRYMIAAEVGGVKPLLCVNKMDLVNEPPDAIAMYEGIGMPVVLTSCETGEGIGELRALLEGKLSVLSGHSGVGKSTLVNILAPDLDLFTQEISEQTNKGRHTTTSSRLYELPGDIRLIDTPGIRQLGLWGVSEEEISHFFPEIAEYGAQCKFRDCTHTHEPGCAVLEGIENGAITRPRYDSYLRIRESLRDGGKTPKPFPGRGPA